MLFQMIACIVNITDEAGMQEYKKPAYEHTQDALGWSQI